MNTALPKPLPRCLNPSKLFPASKETQHETAAPQHCVKILANKVMLLSGEIAQKIKPWSFNLQGRGLQSPLLI